jgi:Patatin-like phospholipase
LTDFHIELSWITRPIRKVSAQNCRLLRIKRVTVRLINDFGWRRTSVISRLKSDQKTSISGSRQPGVFGVAWGMINPLLRWILPAYGVPILLLVSGIVSAAIFAFQIILWGATRQQSFFHEASRWSCASVAPLISAYFAHWLLAISYSILRWMFAHPGPGNQNRYLNYAEDSTNKECKALVFAAPKERGDNPPLQPWRPGNPTKVWDGIVQFERIGFVLAGGGAKGVYQAGAMKAIYESLTSRNAQSSVCSVAGTSIGSWNALF